MVVKNIDKRVLRRLVEQKGQYIAVTVLVAVGIMIFLSFDMAVYNLRDTVDKYYKDYALADIYVYSPAANNLLNKVENTKGIKYAEGRGKCEGRAVFNDDTAKVRAYTITNNINKLYMEGNKKKKPEKNEVYVYHDFADARNLQAGDVLVTRFKGEEINLKIIGTVYSPEFIYVTESEQLFIPDPENFGLLYVSDELMKDISGEGYINEIIAVGTEGYSSDDLEKRVKNTLKNSGLYKIVSKQDQLSYRGTEDEINGEIAMSQSMPVLFLVIASAIMSLLVARMVRNERNEIGVLKALGYSTGRILGGYLKLTFIIGIAGAVVGMLAGALFSYQFTKLYTAIFEIPILVYNFDAKYLFIALGIAIGVSIASGLFGAKKVTVLMPHESMRPESPAKGKHIFLEKFRFYKKLKFSTKMVLRNITRNKKRFYLTVAGVAISFAMLFSPFAFYSFIDTMFVKQYEEVQVMDYDVKFKLPRAEDSIDEILNITDGYIEGYLEIPVDVIIGKGSKMLSVLGIKNDTKIYNLELKDNSTADFKKDSFYISEGFANEYGIQKGDNIKLKLYYPQEKDINIKITGIAKQKLGSNGYIEISRLRDLVDMNSSIYSGAYIQGDINERKVNETGYVSSVLSVEKLMNIYRDFTELIFASLGILVFFGGIIAFIVIYVVSILNINERKREFSSLRVLGLKKNEIFNIVSKENMAGSLIGMFLGVPTGMLMINYISGYFSNSLYSFSMDYTPVMFIYAAAFTIVFVLIGQGVTKRKINSLNFIDALKRRIT